MFAVLLGLLFYSGELTQILSKRNDFLGKVIKEVKFKGNKNTPDSDLESMIEIKVGKTLTKKILDRDLKNLFNSGFFYSSISKRKKFRMEFVSSLISKKDLE